MNRVNNVIKSQQTRRVIRWVTLMICLGLVLGLASPALAQGEIGGVISELVTAITDIIQGIAVGTGILGLSIWGLGKIARPVFPQISQLAGNYISDLLIGVAVVFVAASIVEGIANAIGGG